MIPNKVWTTRGQLTQHIMISVSIMQLLTHRAATLPTFKKLLLQYYYSALTNAFNQDDPRTWKSICPNCSHCSQPGHYPNLLLLNLCTLLFDILLFITFCNCMYFIFLSLRVHSNWLTLLWSSQPMFLLPISVCYVISDYFALILCELCRSLIK